MSTRDVTRGTISDYTTKQSAAGSQTAIRRLLIANGADQVAIVEAMDGTAVVDFMSGGFMFRVPVSPQSVLRVMRENRQMAAVLTQDPERAMEQATRVAWKRTLGWIDAHLTQMRLMRSDEDQAHRRLAEFFAQWAIGGDGSTLWEAMESKRIDQWEAPALGAADWKDDGNS